MSFSKADGELAMFREFALHCLSSVDPDSVKSQAPPAPDVICWINGVGQVAFELGEIVGENLANATNQAYRLRQAFAAEYLELPEAVRSSLESRLGGPPAIFVGINSVPGKWRHTIRPVIDYLVEVHDAIETGEVRVWSVPVLRDLLSSLRIERASTGRAGLWTARATTVQDQTLALLGNKFQKTYASDCPIHLLAYFASQPPPRDPNWLDEVRFFVEAHHSASPFARVWLYSNCGHDLVLVHPTSCG